MYKKNVVKSINKESFFWLIGIVVFFAIFIYFMGAANMFKTMMATAHDLILNTVFL